VLTNYNNTVAGNITPAGQTLVGAGLFTAAQLQALGAVAPFVCLAPPLTGPVANPSCPTSRMTGAAPQVGLGWFKVVDARLSWSYKVKERYKIEPSVAFFNVLNFANFDPAGAPLNGLLGGTPGTVNGTTYSQQTGQRIGVGTGTFAGGSPRTLEFGLRISF
jgi:hypothetical protein